MPFNKTKKYPELLEIGQYSEFNRKKVLKAIFDRDIEDNSNFKFRNKTIRPIKGEDLDLNRTFKHLITEKIEVENDETGKKYSKRIFEMDRSKRIHWIKYHIEENKKDKVEIFSVEERDLEKRKDVIRTYIYDITQKYIVVLEPQRSETDYYIITAYYLNKSYGVKQMKKKMKKKLDEVY